MDGFRTPEEDLRSQNKELEFFFSAKTRPISARVEFEAYSLQLTRTLPCICCCQQYCCQLSRSDRIASR